MIDNPIRSKDNFLVFGSPAMEEEEIEEVVASLRSGWLGTGPKVARFEEDFRKYRNVDHAVAVNSCTAALHLSMVASDLRPGDEVITTPMTFCASINAIIHAGGTPVLVDIDPHTMNIDTSSIEAAITPKTRAILPVHFAGRACEMDELMDIASRHKLAVIEDCAHAIETEYHGQAAGTFGDFGCFSFYVTKNVVTGEGGMIVTGSPEAASRVKVLALHGMSKDAWKRFSDEGFVHYQVTEPGFKYNMMDLQAAIGIHQLERVGKNWDRREAVWNRYNEAFADLPIETPADPAKNTKHGYHLYTILVDEDRADISRDAFLNAIQSNNIGAGVHYLSIPEHAYYQNTYGWRPSDFPVAHKTGQQTVSLPFSAKLNDQDVDDVIAAVTRIVS